MCAASSICRDGSLEREREREREREVATVLVVSSAAKEKYSGRDLGDQVIRENPASRGTETSAEVLVGFKV